MRQSSASPKTNPEAPRLLNQVRDKIRLKHYSIRTEQAYTDWIRRFILYHEKRHPEEMSAVEVEQFLTHLAVAGKVSASTQNQAKSTLLFFTEMCRPLSLKGLERLKFHSSHPIPNVRPAQRYLIPGGTFNFVKHNF